MEMEYYNLDNTLSRGALLSFVLGHRGAGKTYAGKKWAIEDWLRTKKEFVYVRRLDSELAEIKGNLFDDIAPAYNLSIKCVGSTFKIRKVKPLDLEKEEDKEWERENPWKTFGYAMALNLQQDYKSGSWPEVNKIIYDEFIIENPSRRYIKDEPDQFTNLCSTILRHRKGRIVAFSNAGAVWNPYFTAYGITTADLKQQYIKRKKGDVLFEQFHSKGNAEHLRQGLMGRIGTDKYISYAIDSQFKDMDEFMLADPSEYKFSSSWVNLVGATGTRMHVKFTNDGKLFVFKGFVKGLDTYALSKTDLGNTYSKELVARIRDQFLWKNMLFESIDVRLELQNSVENL